MGELFSIMCFCLFGHSRDSLPPVMFSVSPQCAVALELLIHAVFVMADWLSAPVRNRDSRSRRLRSHFNAVAVVCQQLVIMSVCT